jgi:hypothetical protein
LSEDYWFHAADLLIEAMEALEPQTDKWRDAVNASEFKSWNCPGLGCMSAFMLLGGFVVENLCKGCIAAGLDQNARAAALRGELPERLKSHNLQNLVAEIGYTASETEKVFLRELQRIVVWGGRYPVPVSAAEMGPSVQSTSDPDRLKRLIRDLRLHIRRRRLATKKS